MVALSGTQRAPAVALHLLLSPAGLAACMQPVPFSTLARCGVCDVCAVCVRCVRCVRCVHRVRRAVCAVRRVLCVVRCAACAKHSALRTCQPRCALVAARPPAAPPPSHSVNVEQPATATAVGLLAGCLLRALSIACGAKHFG
jgi:hypothetical protein